MLRLLSAGVESVFQLSGLMAKVLVPSGIIKESGISSDSLLKLTMTPVSSSPWAILSCGNSLTSSSVTLQPMA